jgi:hypothetical protein
MQKIISLAFIFLFMACGPKDQCTSQADCDDSSACTEDICSAGQCQNNAVNLEDNNACTTDACDPITGTSHNLVAGIDDNNLCTNDDCDPVNGTISHTPLPNTDDNNACTTDSCDPVNGPTHDPIAGIDDNDPCTTDSCDTQSGVISHDAIVTDDNNACTTDTCDPITGVSHTQLAGVNDNNACTIDSCDTQTGTISHDPLANINDNNACTNDACDITNGTITHAPLAGIDDNNACTINNCDTQTGTVSHPPLAAINDGVACTADTCNPTNGNITHTADDSLCSETDDATCTLPTCDPTQGCFEQELDFLCGDSQACTTSDICDPALANADPTTGCAFTIDNTVCDDTVDCTDDVCTPNTGCSNTANDGNCNPGETCDPTADCLGNVPVLAEGVITEFVALGSAGNLGELIEIHNPGLVNGDISGGTITNAAGEVAIIHPRNNPTGQNLINIPAGGFIFGVPNSTNLGNIPIEAAFVYGEPGTTFEIGDAGDNLVLRNRNNGTLDVVNFLGNFATNPNVPVSPNVFPGFAGVSTQLDAAHLNASDNGDGANWCTTFRLFDTAGQTNLSCSASTVVINEVVYDGALGADTADPRKTFIELSGPGGALIKDLRIRGVEGSGVQAGNIQAPDIRIGSFIANARMPVDGLFVIADNTGGASQVVPANQRDLETTFAPETSDDALQLLLDDGNGGVSFVDAVGYAADGVIDDATDNTNNLATFEGSPAHNTNQGVSLSRNAVSIDTNNNLVDFGTDPSPSPGEINQPVITLITSIVPNDGLSTVTTPVVITGSDLGPSAAITFAGVSVPAANCNFTGSPTVITCNIPPGTIALRGDVSYANAPDSGNSTGTSFNGWTYTGVLNETNVGPEADFCDIQFPFATTTTVNVPSELIFGQIFEGGVTDFAVGFPAANITAELGVGPLGADPTVAPGWVFFSTQFNVETGINNNNDEYKGTLTIPVAGVFSYTYRFSIDGINFTYCDQGPDAGGDGGSGSNGGLTFESNRLGTITVQ